MQTVKVEHLSFKGQTQWCPINVQPLSEKETAVLQWEFKLNSALAKRRHLALHMPYAKG